MQMVLLENLVKFHWIGDKLDETMKKNKCRFHFLKVEIIFCAYNVNKMIPMFI